MPPIGRVVEWRLAGLIPEGRAGLALQQAIHDVTVPFHRRQVQRSPALGIAHIEVGPLLDVSADLRDIADLCRLEKGYGRRRRGL